MKTRKIEVTIREIVLDYKDMERAVIDYIHNHEHGKPYITAPLDEKDISITFENGEAFVEFAYKESLTPKFEELDEKEE